MDNDRTLLEKAAKAAGIVGAWEVDATSVQRREYFNVPYDNHNMLSGFEWNPLREDADALRLAVRLEIDVRNFNGNSHAGRNGEFWCTEKWFPDGDMFSATRRAIVRAAAAIGEQT